LAEENMLIKVVYEELTNFLGKEPARIQVEAGKSSVIMLVGIQGSGKTTSTAKLARFLQKRGYKTGLICADTFRLGAYAQLKQLAEKINVPLYGDVEEPDAFKVAIRGVDHFREEKYEVISWIRRGGIKMREPRGRDAQDRERG